jgi:urease gamma subunit
MGKTITYSKEESNMIWELYRDGKSWDTITNEINTVYNNNRSKGSIAKQISTIQKNLSDDERERLKQERQASLDSDTKMNISFIEEETNMALELYRNGKSLDTITNEINAVYNNNRSKGSVRRQISTIQKNLSDDERERLKQDRQTSLDSDASMCIPFTEEESNMILGLYRNGKSLDTIANEINAIYNNNRSKNSVIHQISTIQKNLSDDEKERLKQERQFSLNSDASMCIPFTEEESNMALELYRNGKSLNTIVNEINAVYNNNRNKDTVKGKIRDIQKTFTDDERERLKQDRQTSLNSDASMCIPFTEEESNMILGLYRNGKSLDTIANEINAIYNNNRSKQSVKGKIRDIQKNLGDDEKERLKQERQTSLDLDAIMYIPITDEETKLIFELYMAGEPYDNIAREINTVFKNNRSYSSINSYVNSIIQKNLSEDQQEILKQERQANLKKLTSISRQEIDFFNTLAAMPDIPHIQRNVRASKPIKDTGRYYNIDGVGPGKVAIEYNGTLWHADPVKYHYPDQYLRKLECTVGEIWGKNAIREKFLREHGYHIVIIWEREWTKKKTKQACIERVRQAFRERGLLLTQNLCHSPKIQQEEKIPVCLA